MKISNLGTKISTALVSGSAFLATAGIASAQGTGGTGVGNVAAIPILDGSIGIRRLVSNVVNYGLAIIGIIAVVYLIWGGVTYITAGGDAEKAGKGRIAITNAIIGIVIIIAALVIYNAVIGIGSNNGTLT